MTLQTVNYIMTHRKFPGKYNNSP